MRPVKAGTLVAHGGGGEIVKEETDEIENGGGFENHGVVSRRKFDADLRDATAFSLADSARATGSKLGKFGGIRFGPTGAEPCLAW